MSLNRSVRFGPSLAETHRPAQMGRIMHLGYMTPLEPVITTPEGVGLGVGGALLVTGAVVKSKKTGLILMILGGAGALYGIGSAIYRAIAKPSGPAVPVAVKPATPGGAAALVQQLAPAAMPLITKLFTSQPNAPAPAPASPFVTSIPGYSGNPGAAPSSSVITTTPVVTPAPSDSGDGGMVTSLDDGVAGLRGW